LPRHILGSTRSLPFLVCIYLRSTDTPQQHTRSRNMAVVLTPRGEFSGESKSQQIGDFHTVYLEESSDEISSVGSIDPAQFLQEEMLVEEERLVNINTSQCMLMRPCHEILLLLVFLFHCITYSNRILLLVIYFRVTYSTEHKMRFV